MALPFPLLSTLIWLPIAGAIFILMMNGDKRALWARWIGLAVALLCLMLCFPLWQQFDITRSDFQFIEMATWLPGLGIQYALGVDGFAMPLILLTCLFTPIVIGCSWYSVQQRVGQFLAAFLIMQGLMCGVFAALDSILFYVFWEAMLIPMFLIIGIWGGPSRVYATLKFFMYTFFGSVFLLVAIIYLHQVAMNYGMAEPFALTTFKALPLGLSEQKWLFFAFLLAFGVKVPMWPVHTWLPDAHTEAPTAGSVVLAAMMLKMGAYGFLRFILPITTDAARELQWLVINLSLVGIVYIGLVAIVQKDMKKLIAYSSVAHMGFVTLGIFISFSLVQQPSTTGAGLGLTGAFVQMISHGFISAALFLCVGILYDRLHSRAIADYGGVANSMPIFACFLLLFAFANSGMPGTSGFIGEFMIIIAAFQSHFMVAALAATTLILGASYSLWMIKRVLFGAIKNPAVATLKDVNRIELVSLGGLACLIIVVGLWPAPLIEVSQATVNNLLQHITQAKY
jgi:NADH-quinone oxidoreductase subunit M